MRIQEGNSIKEVFGMMRTIGVLFVAIILKGIAFSSYVFGLKR